MTLRLLRTLLRPYIFLPALYVAGCATYLVMSSLTRDFPFRFDAEYLPGLVKVGLFYVLTALSSFFGYVFAYQELRRFSRKARSSIVWKVGARRLARMLAVVSSASILLYVYLVMADFGTSRFWDEIVRGEQQLGVLARYKANIPFIGAFHFLLPTAAVLYAITEFHLMVPIARYEWLGLLGVAIIRSFVAVARIFVVWTVLPVLVVGCHSPDSRIRKKMARLFLICIAGVVVLFTAQGALRSYRDGSWDSLFSYAGTMLSYYFVGGLHYSAVLGSFRSPYAWPVESTRWLQSIGLADRWERSIDYEAFQETYGLPQFNTYGLFGTLYLDFGDWVFAVAILFGIVLGILYGLYWRRCVTGLLLYPIIFTYLVDSLRINAFVVTQGIIPIILGCVSAAILGFLRERGGAYNEGRAGEVPAIIRELP